jgi:hypothetical protein
VSDTENQRPLVLHIGGEDVRMRIPLLKKLESAGFAVAAAGSEDGAPFSREGLTYFRYALHRGLNPLATHLGNRELAALIDRAKPALIHAWDTKPAMFAPPWRQSAAYRSA